MCKVFAWAGKRNSINKGKKLREEIDMLQRDRSPF